jgi:hypothetical protein
VIVFRIAAALAAVTWLVVPGFGVIDLGVSWDAGWPVVLEASWGAVMTVLVAGSFLVLALRPRSAAPAVVVLTVTGASWVAAAAAGREPELLGYAALLAAESALVLLVRDRARPRPVRLSVSVPLLVLALAGLVPWGLHALTMFRINRLNVFEATGDITMGVDHQAVQGGMALGLAALALLAAVWPRGRRYLGITAGLVAGYLGLVSSAFPGTPAALSPTWSLLCLGWGVALAVLAVLGARSELRELVGEVVEAERSL